MTGKVKAIYVGKNGNAEKVWENGVVLDEDLYNYTVMVRQAQAIASELASRLREGADAHG